MKTLICIFLVVNCPVFSFGQIKVFAEAFVTYASSNGQDITNIAVENNEVIVFYTSDDDGLIYMSNYWVKTDSQSYGELTSTKKTKKTTYHSFKADVQFYTWHYINSYDTNQGYAKIKLTKIYKPNQVAYIMEIFPENNDELVYKGELKGEL